MYIVFDIYVQLPFEKGLEKRVRDNLKDLNCLLISAQAYVFLISLLRATQNDSKLKALIECLAESQSEIFHASHQNIERCYQDIVEQYLKRQEESWGCKVN